jgi:serine/threonine protein kinase
MTGLIAGRYQPLEAARASAPVRVRDLQTAQTLLLRAIDVPAADGARTLARARAAAGIFHPSLVTLFDVVVDSDTRLLLAYEFVPAQPAAVVTGGTAFNIRRAAQVVAEIADAVAELHAREVVHGSITLTTVLLTLKGKAKLDRVGDPSILTRPDPTAADDLVALGDLLLALAGSGTGRGMVGLQGIETLAARARAGKFESAATFAALLRRAAE